MTTARTCVVTINYRNAEDTGRCVDSLRRSAVPVDAYVVDNSPHDPALQAAVGDGPRSRIISAADNLGFGRANNLGFEQAMQNAEYEFVLFLNNDAIVEADAIGHLQACADRHPQVGIVAPRIVLMEHPEILWYGGGHIDWSRGGAVVPGVLGAATAPQAMRARAVEFASGCGMLLRTRVMQALGGFDPRFFMYEEDVDLCLRAASAGVGIRYEPAAVVRHKVQGSMPGRGGRFTRLLSPDNENAAFYGYHVARNKLLNVRAHTRGLQRARGLAGVGLFLARRMTSLLLRQRFTAARSILRGVREGIRS